MLTPMPADFWTQVVREVATMIFNRETSRGVTVSPAMQSIPAMTYSHDARKPWHAPADADASADPA